MDVAARLKAERAALVEAGPAPGRGWCRAWTDHVDAGLRELAGEFSARGRFALVATGGYGRRELTPGSDIDLLLLYDGVAHEDLENAVRIVVYPLWDAGLKVGHAVRDRRQAISAALDDVETATATLDGRLLAGDAALFRGVHSQLVTRLRKRVDRFIPALAEADRSRRERTGDAIEALEPDLKRGAGSLRDVQSLRWAAAGMLGETGLDPLVSARYLGAADRTRLARAYDLLLAVRVALHLEAERPQDVLRLEHQQGVALRLGYVDGATDLDTAAHRVVRDVYLGARTIDHVHRRAWALLAADAEKGRRFRRSPDVVVDGFGIADGVLTHDAEYPIGRASDVTRLLVALAGNDAVLDRTLATRLRRGLEHADGLPWDAAARRHVTSTFWRGSSAMAAITELDDVGAWTAMLPEWAPLRGRPQRNPFHDYSLDRHALHAATALGDLVREQAWASDALESVDDREGLVLGALLHDVGKAFGEPHTESGQPVARAIVARMGGSEATADLVARMVELHLLLPDVATRRDLSDPALPGVVAERIGDRQLLACLHLLAAADGAATGPSSWTSWKQALVHQLVTKVRAVFDQIDPDELADSAVATAREAQALAEGMGSTAEQVRGHLSRLPARYAAAVSPRAVVRHTLVTSEPLQPAEVRTRVTPGTDGDGPLDELDVIALDTPGLFSKVAGVLALHGGSILGAHAFTRADGVAVDTFFVERPDAAPGPWWAIVEGDLVEAVAGRLALRARVAAKAASVRPRGPRLDDVATTVEVVDDDAGAASVVEVTTADDVGVLFRIAEALAELQLDIVAARIATIGNLVTDAFYVRDATGERLGQHHADEVVLAITAALA